MSFLPGNQETRLTSTTPVAIVSAPGAGVIRLVKEIIVINDDTKNHTIRARLTGTELGTVDFKTEDITQDTSENLMNDTAVIVLDTTGQTIELYTSSAISTSNPVVTVEYADFTPVDVTPFIVRWDTNIDFNKGAFVDTSVSGVGNAAIVQVDPESDNDDDIPYTTPANYTLSDGTDLEIASGFARLKALTGTDKDWPFTTPANYTYVGTDVEVTGGVGQLKSQAPANATFYAKYNSVIDGNWGDGVLTGSATGGAAISGGFLDLTHADVRYVDYGDDDNFAATQTGCIRFVMKPNYSGTPVTQQILVDVHNGSNNNNRVVIWQAAPGSGGGLWTRIATGAGSSIFVSETWGAWSPTAGVEYEFELNWDVTTGASRLFIDGVQLGSTKTETGTHDLTGLTTVRVGSNFSGTETSDFAIKDFLLFDAVQHTANYTPGATIPEFEYLETDPTIESVTGFAFSSSLNSFTVDDTVSGSALKYQVSSDDGTTFKWWNGSAWVARITSLTQNVASAIATITGTHDAGNLASIQTLDASTYDVSEVTGVPGFSIEIDWNNIIVQPSQITIYGYYAGNPGHVVNVQMWNYSLAQWDTMGTLPNAGSITQYNFAVTGTKADYFSGTAARVRIYHATTGTGTHDIFIDYAYILLDSDPSDSWYYDNEANTEAEVDTNIAALAASGTFQWLAFLHSNDGTETPIVTNINVGETVTYSTTDNLYIDTKDASQIAPANIAAWLTALVTNTLPANTAIGLLVSTDGRVTWQKDIGAGWVTEGAPTLRANSMTIAQLVANIATLPLGSGTFDVRLFLYTSVNTVRPTVSNINITSDAGFPATGTWESNEYDSENLGQDWGEVNFTVVTPGGSTIAIKARAGDVSGSLGSYGSTLADGDDAGVTGRYIQFFATLTPDGVNNPQLDRAQCAYVTPIVTEVAP